MLINNSKKIVIKLGSSTVIDEKGKFKKKWVNSLIQDIKKYRLYISNSGNYKLNNFNFIGYNFKT